MKFYFLFHSPLYNSLVNAQHNVCYGNSVSPPTVPLISKQLKIGGVPYHFVLLVIEAQANTDTFSRVLIRRTQPYIEKKVTWL